MAWVAVAAAATSVVGGAIVSDINSPSASPQPPSAGSNVVNGGAGVIGGMLSSIDAQNFASQVSTTANPFGKYNNQFGQQLASAAGNGTFGNATPAGNVAATNYTNGTTLPQTSALSGVGSQLASLAANPDSVYQTQQYKSAFGQGQNAVNSTLAAQGLNGSGNQLAALQNYGQTFGMNAYGQQLSQLSGLYGQSLTANQQGYGQVANNAALDQSSNSTAFNQLALLSGASNGSPTAAAQAQSNILANVNSAGQAVGQGAGQLLNGVANGGIGQIGNAVGNLFNGASDTTTGSNSYGFDTGMGTTTYDPNGAGATLNGLSSSGGGGGYSYSGADTYGFTQGASSNSWGF